MTMASWIGSLVSQMAALQGLDEEWRRLGSYGRRISIHILQVAPCLCIVIGIHLQVTKILDGLLREQGTAYRFIRLYKVPSTVLQRRSCTEQNLKYLMAFLASGHCNR